MFMEKYTDIGALHRPWVDYVNASSKKTVGWESRYYYIRCWEPRPGCTKFSTIICCFRTICASALLHHWLKVPVYSGRPGNTARTRKKSLDAKKWLQNTPSNLYATGPRKETREKEIEVISVTLLRRWSRGIGTNWKIRIRVYMIRY